ncbi:MAG: mandelate racemase/muconate lactonizing enzyme family protein [Leptolyngbya sp. SIO4C1]|nr:mandelate racemase/muconate lactonizing enzyme family protein [Leptolyngbya sp. SIO4C1]
MTDRIASITPHLIPADARPHPWWSHKAYILVRVETSDGIVGWGECHNLSYREKAIVAIVDAIAPTLIGRASGDIRGLFERAYNSFGQQRPGLDVYCAFAGIEIALWDILGKRLDVPVYQLLGGSLRDSVPVYANIYSPHPQTAEDFAAMAAHQVAGGHRAIKLYPFDADTSIADGVKRLSAVREAVGPDIGLAVDLWRHASPYRAIELARAMEPFDLLWIEDPFAPTDPKTVRYVRDTIRQPLLTGETLPSRREFNGLFEERAVDIINPDICLSGILELQAIASMAEAAHVSVSPHNSNSMAIGTAAAIHASLGLSNLEPVEYFPLFETALDDLCQGRPQIVNGQLPRPEARGLGVEVSDAAARQYRV